MRREPSTTLAGLFLGAGWLGLWACGDNPATPTALDTGPVAPSAASGCAVTTTGMVPLSDLGGGAYRGAMGGLYPRGNNAPPAFHQQAGLERARAIGPRDAQGLPDANGRYVFLSIGMSNTTQEFSTFKRLADGDPRKDPRLLIVDGAQGGVTALDWSSPGCPCWGTIEQRLRNAGVSGSQVATAWLKLADRSPASGWPRYAETLRDETIAVLQLLKTRFPHLELAYLSSRTYAGYATTPLNPEPYAYESGFSVKWVVEEQLNGSPALRYDRAGGGAVAPWVSWGPYLWADGLTPRADGITWACSDFRDDGTHPSAAGQQKVAELLLDFLLTDPTAVEWFTNR